MTSLPPWPSITFAPPLTTMLSAPWLPMKFSMEDSASVPVCAPVAVVGVIVTPAEIADRSSVSVPPPPV
ncbi:hypothetical protein D9M69_694980 [compost metagenome]